MKTLIREKEHTPNLSVVVKDEGATPKETYFRQAFLCTNKETMEKEQPLASIGTIFARTEKKYVINRTHMKKLLPKLSEYMKSDLYGKTHITSLYLDTPTFYLMRQSIEKPSYKEKYRIRWYGEANCNHQVFFEVKKKLKGVVYKRRVPMSYEEAMRYTMQRIAPRLSENLSDEQRWESKQIIREFNYAFEIYENLGPSLLVSYDRTALVDINNEDVRITFDTNINWAPGTFPTEGIVGSQQILSSDQIIMEVKCNKAMPLWLTNILDMCEIHPRSFSKSGTAYKAFMAKGGIIQKEACCA